MGEKHTKEGLQGLVDVLWDLFTLDGEDVRREFSDSRLVDDHARINYATELMADYVSEESAVCTARLNEFIEARIARDWRIFEEGRKHEAKHRMVESRDADAAV